MSQFLVASHGAVASPLVLQQLERWNRMAARAFAPATRAAYNSDLTSFGSWCALSQLAVLPAMPETVAAYLRAEAAGGWRTDEHPKALSTVKRRAAAIAKAHVAAGAPNPCDSEEVRLALREIGRDRKGVGQKQAAALTQREADRISGRLDASSRLRDMRDLALLLVGRDLMARASELVAVTAEDIIPPQEGRRTQVLLLRGKTDDEKRPLALGADAADALTRWLEEAHITSGPAFRAITKGGRVKGRAITRQDVCRIVKALAGRGFSAHSLRIGMTHDLVAANAGTAAIMEAGGWSSEAMVKRYSRNLSADQGAVSQYHRGRGR